MAEIRWHCLSDPRAVAEEAVQRVVNAAQVAVERRGLFRLVLAGGSTPLLAYQQLRDLDVDCLDWHLYLGDERCLPRNHNDRNSLMISHAWLDHSLIPADQIHWIPAELGNTEGARLYQAVIADAIPFDMVLLGMGEDGHTASLFPGHDHDLDELVVAVDAAPKPPPERISLNFSALNQTREMLVLVTGDTKRDVVSAWKSGEDLPVSRLSCESGVDVLLDAAACAD